MYTIVQVYLNHTCKGITVVQREPRHVFICEHKLLPRCADGSQYCEKYCILSNMPFKLLQFQQNLHRG